MSHKKLRPFIAKVSVLGYFPLIVIYLIDSSILVLMNQYSYIVYLMVYWVSVFGYGYRIRTPPTGVPRYLCN